MRFEIVTPVAVAFLAAFISAQHPPSLNPPPGIVERVESLRVPYGRSVFVNPLTNLKINVHEGDYCFVIVLPDPSDRMPGFISPEHFPCNFGPEDVKYSHLGSRSPSEHKIRLQIRYDTPTETYVIPIALPVEVLFIQRTVVTKALFITVPELLGTSEAIDGEILEFTYEPGHTCQVTTNISPASLPHYGELINDPSEGAPISCSEFLAAGAKYQHTALTDSPNTDLIPMVVEILNEEGELVTQEYFQIRVRITDGIENTPPVTDFLSTMMMEVDQFVMTAITPDMLRAQDKESDPADLVFNITEPLKPQQGGFYSTDDRNQEIRSFYQSDVNNLRIAYRPPAVDSDELRFFKVKMQIIDTEGMMSDPFDFVVVVKPMNTMAPVVTRNTGQLLYQGQSRALSSRHNLEISDEDNLGDVTVSVVSGATHGSLVKDGATVKTFTPADLDAGVVEYHHDGTNTYSDNIVFQMSDGKNKVEFLFAITIATVDNTPPILDANTGLTINKGATEVITTWILSAADVDSEDLDIKFVMAEPYSTEGQFLLISEEPEDDLDAWTERPDGRWEKEVLQFTEANLLSMEVYYRHIGPHSTEVVMDRIRFHVEDDNVPPNKSPIETFVVKIVPVDDIPPNVHGSATLRVDVNEYELTTLEKKFLRYTDQDTDDRELVYTLTSPITELSPVSPLEDFGKLVLQDHPEQEVDTFTQAQINHHKIAYQPPDVELGLISRILQFTFSVTDNAGNELPNQVFTIFLRPVDNKPPQIVNTGFTVRERSTASITSDILDATDADSNNDVLTFTVLRRPTRGIIYYDDVALTVGGAFTRDDIANMHMMYQHNGDESTSDVFDLEVSDGMHTIPIKVKVDVEPIDDEIPTLALPLKGELNFKINVKERGMVVITPEVLSATDSDTNDLALTFLITSLPSKGQIIVSGEPVNSFTQENIRNGQVKYMHTAGEIGPDEDSDTFSLTLSDLSDDWSIGGNKVDTVLMAVKILPVDSEAPVVTIGEDYNVNEGDRATIELRHLSATDEDTERNEIICVVITQPMEGFLENISPAPGSEKSRKGIPISSFTMGDIIAGNINYMQSANALKEPIVDRFSFVCQDGTPNVSPSEFFNIAIDPVNDEEPLLYYTEFVLDEGGQLIVDLPRLSAEDYDIPEDELTFTVIEPPKNGQFLRKRDDDLVPESEFTLNDVASSNIVYQHDGTETTDDKFEIALNDGEHEVKQIIPITIRPVDDETPRMTINNGIDVDIYESKIISNNVLKATDLDSDDSTLTFIITFGPHHGNLSRTNAEGRMITLKVGDNFTQKDIDDNKIAYHHTGQEGVRDLVKFDVTDGLNPLIDRYFYINVGGIDMLFPSIVNKGVTLKEGGHVTLTTDILSTDDMNSNDEDLSFTIAHAPTRGHLESTDQPGVPITTFTQLELAGNKIKYVHTSIDEIKMDSFEFEVTDGFNPVYRTFRISISDVDNKKPVVTISTLRLKEGSTKLITPFEMKVEDRDTKDRQLKISITQVPVHGKILKNGNPTRSFTMADLNHNRVSYAHDGSETVGDSFSFTVSDGSHNDFFVFPDTVDTTEAPQRMDIEIIAVDNGVPQLLINRGAQTISEMASGKHGYRITKKVLRADDRDSDVAKLRYVVSTPAEHGYLVNIADGEDAIEEFTQGDIDEMNIFYILNPGSNATADEFKFKVVDKGENELDEQKFMLNWAIISLSSANYNVSEEEKYLEIILKRRGYLGETSFVTISTRNGTATEGADFKTTSANQVQFNPGQSEGKWRVRILQDEEYEQSEIFYVDLSDPVMGIIEEPSNSSVEITDQEDESTVFFPEDVHIIQEDIGEFLIPVRRSGDLNKEMMVVCYTEQESATGTTPTTVLSYSDYISRPNDHNSIIKFEKGESEKNCRIVIIDDSLYEEDEKFFARLTSPMGGRLGEFSDTEITIEADSDDEPMIYFEADSYQVDESDGHVEVHVWRTGPDLDQIATVTVRSKQSEVESAKANEDYVGISETITFAPQATMQPVRVVILDDLGNPKLEGSETFELILTMPRGAMLGEPGVTVVTINDSYSDLPLMQFAEETYEVDESDESLSAKIVRSGDLSQTSSVRCYTRQSSAEVMMDYAERPNTDASIVKFEPGQSEGHCTVIIENDGIHEDPEKFRLVLGTPTSESAGEARVGETSETTVTILDHADRPVIGFEKTTYEVTEPGVEGIATLSVAVIRKGDATQTSSVRFFTKDGNAESGKDYNPLSKELVFDVNVTRQVVDLQILYDEEKEIRESFTIRLEPDTSMIADLGESRAIIYINQEKILADVTFPHPPSVFSLLDYDDTGKAKARPAPGYPVVCVTSCNPKHHGYDKVADICTSEGIDDKQTRYRWLVAAPSSSDNVTNNLREVAQNTFFTDSNSITLDSIFFKPGSRIACAARAVTDNGDPGIEMTSQPVTVSKIGKICPPRVAGSVGAEPFSAKFRYTGASHPDYPNLIKVSVLMPHIDGMLPVISTRKLSNYEITLSRDASRVGNHRCSNILNFDEIKTQHGFISEGLTDRNIIGETYPYQFSSALRGNNTLRFYKNLNLEACLWNFESYYDMSELLNECGGDVGTDGQVLNNVQSYVSLRVPLYVSNVFHSPVGKGWQHFDQETELRLTFTYDTAALWDNGIGSPPESEIQGYVYPTSMRIGDEGKLVVNFRTEARFRGQFVLDHPSTEQTSMVMSSNHPELELSLNLVRTESTYNQPEQIWTFTSKYAIRDYSGTYTIKLIPCTTTADQSYSIPITCNPREPLTFDIDIRFQQVSDPVSAEFSLNTNFYLLSKKSLWLSDGSMGYAEDTDVAFVENANIYGRVSVDPVQNLGDSFDATIEKVFICTGRDGYIPKYNPENDEYGCLADVPTLLHQFKILDKEQPDTQQKDMNSVGFDAKLAVDDPEALPIVQQSGTDGFRMASRPLFTVTSGREWYLHVIYSVAQKTRSRRSILHTYNAVLKSGNKDVIRSKRNAPNEVDTIGRSDNRGTNMGHVVLKPGNSGDTPVRGDGLAPEESSTDTSNNSFIFIIIAVVGLLVMVGIIASVIILKKRAQPSDGRGAYSGGKVTATAAGVAVLDDGYGGSESSEV
uniref:FRAS1-related extracellular matrix protein 2-like n=1 Tax=Styela clava TaxID=7725 RepID=UPI00193A7AD3|nr:FRAS1-related extracellular matrix protein 2-like [Styela clava]